jgi:hypothetical protein
MNCNQELQQCIEKAAETMEASIEARIGACIKACEGIADPVAEIAHLKSEASRWQREYSRCHADLCGEQTKVSAFRREAAELREGEKWLAGKLCEIMATAISGMGVQAVVVGDGPFGAEYVLSVVQNLAKETNELRGQRDELLERLKGLVAAAKAYVEWNGPCANSDDPEQLEEAEGIDAAINEQGQWAEQLIARCEGGAA